MQPIILPIAGLNLNMNGSGMRKLGVAPNFCGAFLLPAINLTVSGVTKDETGAASGGFTVYLMDMLNGVPRVTQTTISDGSGNYSFSVGRGGYWAVSYKDGSPDKAGATSNKLAGI